MGEGDRGLLLLRFVSAFSWFELGVAGRAKSSLESGSVDTFLALRESKGFISEEPI